MANIERRRCERKMRVWGYKPKNVGSLEQPESVPRASRRTPLCQHLDFNPGKLTGHLLSRAVREYTHAIQAIMFVVTPYSSHREGTPSPPPATAPETEVPLGLP